ncbi:MAG: O-acetyl-ADP-ribose deacetylase [Ignavibacteria bacterium]|nr:O-acetyl-ADP-ribose deacetylase [Ignavibacteria bacterium]
MNRISIIKGDITKLEVDAIVNAANKTLLGGGGVDGAIHRAAGRQLYEKCKTLNGCETGEAKITRGYNLPAKNVIHTAGPVWHGGKYNEPSLLKNCYLNSLKLAKEHNLKTIAFPSISTGVYGYPIEEASKIAVDTVMSFLKENSIPEEVTFVCFSDSDLKVYKKNFKNISL